LAEIQILEGSRKKGEPLGILFWICVGWIALNVFVAIFANVLPFQNPLNEDFTALNAAPSLHHLFGADDLGRDILARVAYGSRVSISVGIGAMIIGFGVGAPLGMLAAYRRGRFDAILTTVMYVMLAFPAIIATIAVLSFWTPRSLTKIIIVIGVASIPLVYRVIRTATLSVATKDYVVAAKSAGRDRPANPDEGTPPQHRADRHLVLVDRHRDGRHARRRAGLPRPFRDPADAVVGQHDQRGPHHLADQSVAGHLSVTGALSVPALSQLHR
jgi:hypothetical protein